MKNAAEQKKQDGYFQSNIQRMIDLADARMSPRFSLFLDERQRAMAEDILRHSHSMEKGLFFGGAPGCERVMLGAFPEGTASEAVFPIAALRASYGSHSGGEALTHRDYLGALMGLGIKRESVGDILLQEGSAVLFVSRELSGFVCTNLTSVGRISVTVGETAAEGLFKEQAFSTFTGTVASLRLDCVAALLLRGSRREAAEAIEGGTVRVNGLECTNTARQLSPGDRLTIRGTGKFILGDELKKTKKDRICITVKKYV